MLTLILSLFLFRAHAHIHAFNLRVTKISTISTTYRMNEMNGAPNSYSKTIWSIHRVNREKIAKYKTNMYTQHIRAHACVMESRKYVWNGKCTCTNIQRRHIFTTIAMRKQKSSEYFASFFFLLFRFTFSFNLLWLCLMRLFILLQPEKIQCERCMWKKMKKKKNRVHCIH